MSSGASYAEKPLGARAIVIGASIGGLLAARVLADYFDKVTLVERDALPEQPVWRSGVPQGHHLHVLLMRGQRSFERFFPDFRNRMTAEHLPVIHWLQDVRFLLSKGWLSNIDLGLTTNSVTRPRLELIIRQELARIPNIEFEQGCDVTQLLYSEQSGRVEGVTFNYRRAAGQTTEKTGTLRADFVVDASGRDSHTPEWLTALGFGTPQETVVNAFLGYASRLYESLSYEPDWKAMLVTARPPDQPRGGVVSMVEDGKWMVLLSGAAKDYPSTDEEAFLPFARSLSDPALYEAIKDGKPASPIYGYQRTANVMRHYEALTRWPKRFAVLGDAVCCFNPVYGQGMTVSALGAETLADTMRETRDLDALGQKFQTRLAASNKLPWLMATGTDFQFPQTEGQRPSGSSRFVQSYLLRMQEAMPTSHLLSKTFVGILHMITSPATLFKPQVILRVLGSMMRR